MTTTAQDSASTTCSEVDRLVSLQTQWGYLFDHFASDGRYDLADEALGKIRWYSQQIAELVA
jgi:hypothetical protein